MPKKDLERSTVVDTTIAELNKKYGSGSIMRLGDMGGAEVVPKFTSGIASLDLALGGGWPCGRIIEVYGPESSGKCLTEDTRILTKNGYKTIKEIFNENGLETYCVSKAVEVVYPLVNKDGNLEDTTHFVFNNRRPVNKIVTRSGSVIKSTDMHPMCIVDENGFMVWKYSKDIVPGDYLVGRKGDKYSSKSSLVSTEEAILLGVMVADAYFGEAKISLTNNSPEIINLFSRSTEIVEEFSGLKLKQYLAKNHENNGSLDFQINSKEQVPKFYDRVGIKSGLAKDKNVPASILRSNIDIQAAFLKGYFDCESELSSGVGEIVVTSASFDLLSSIQLMLRNMGILSYISKKVVKKYEDNDYWRLGIYSHYVEKFSNEIGFLSQERIEKIEEILKERNSTIRDRLPNIEGLVVSYYSSVDKRHKNSETSDWIYSIKSQKSGVSVNKLKMLLEIPSQNVHLRQLLMTYLDEHLYFDEVYAVEKMDSVPTFDFSMKDTHTFIAEGIINHNTSLCLFAMAEAQKLGQRVAFIDLENALDPMLAEMYGVDTNNMYLGYPDTGEAAFAIIEGLAQTGEFGCIVLDSVSAILPNAEREEDVGKSLPAIQARLMSQVLRRLVGVLGKSQTTVFFVNQIREKVGVMYGNPEITSGGRALSFYASQRINVRIDTFLDKKGKEQRSRDGAFGHKTNIQVSKNKVAPPFKRAGFMLEYGKGFDKYYDVLLVAEELGVIGKGGAWYNYVPEDKSLIAEGEENLRWQGRNNLLNDLKSNHKLFAEIQQKTFKEVSALYSKPKPLEEVMEEPDES
jgi:protein RecA